MAEAMRFNSVEEELAYLRSRVEAFPENKEAVKRTILNSHQELPTPVRQSLQVKETLQKVSEDRDTSNASRKTNNRILEGRV